MNNMKKQHFGRGNIRMVAKKAALWALALCFLLPVAYVQAAPGDANVFKYPTDYPAELTTPVARNVALVGDTFYGVGTKLGQDAEAAATDSKETIYRWKPGMEQPEGICDIQGQEVGYYGAYDKAPENVKPKMAEQASLLLSDGQKLYAFNSFVGRIGEVSEQGIAWGDVQLDMKDMVTVPQGPEEEAYPRNVWQGFMDSGKLYVVRDNYSDGVDQAEMTIIVCWDLATGAQTTLPVKNVHGMTPYKPGQALLLCYGYDEAENKEFSRVSAIDLATGAVTDLPLEMPAASYNIGGLAYDAASDSIYYLYQGQVWRSVAGAPFAAVAYLVCDYINDNSVAWILPGNFYAVYNNGLFVRNVDPQYMAARALRIQGGWGDRTFTLFTEKNPDVPVLLIEGWSGDSEGIANAIKTNDKSVDVFVTSVYDGLVKLIEKGYAADLSGSKVLTDDVNSMYPAIQDVLVNDAGKLMAYPREISLSPWGIDKALWDEYDMGDVPATYSQLLDAMIKWQDAIPADEQEVVVLGSVAEKRNLIDLIISAYIRQYETPDQPIDFESPVLREVLEKVEQLEFREYDYEKMNDADWEEYSEWMNRPSMISPYYGNGMFNDPNTTKYISSDPESRRGNYDQLTDMLPLVFEEGQQPKLMTMLTVYVVNPASPNIDLATQYLEFAATEGAENMLRYATHPDLNTPVEQKDFAAQVKRMQEWRAQTVEEQKNASPADQRNYQDSLDYIDRWLAEQDKNKWEISEAAIANYRNTAQYMDLAADSMYRYSTANSPMEEINTLQERLASGEMALDAFLKELNNKMKMMFLEGK